MKKKIHFIWTLYGVMVVAVPALIQLVNIFFPGLFKQESGGMINIPFSLFLILVYWSTAGIVSWAIIIIQRGKAGLKVASVTSLLVRKSRDGQMINATVNFTNPTDRTRNITHFSLNERTFLQSAKEIKVPAKGELCYKLDPPLFVDSDAHLIRMCAHTVEGKKIYFTLNLHHASPR